MIMSTHLKSSKRLEGVREFRLTMSSFGQRNDHDLTWIYFKIRSTFHSECFKHIFVSIRFESTTDKNLDIHHVWSIEKFSDRLQLYTHFWNKIWISIFVFPWRSFKRSNNFRSVHLSNFLYICLTQLTNIMYTRVSPYCNVCYIWSLTQLMIHR